MTVYINTTTLNFNQLFFSIMKLLHIILIVSGCSLVWAGKKHDECDCINYMYDGVLKEVCPGSTFQFEDKGWHGSCDSKGKDPESGKCKCYSCNSCSLLDMADF